MKKSIFAVALLLPALGYGADISNSCLAQACNPGEKAVTFASKEDTYFACPTRELSEYTNNVLGMVSMTHQMTGSLPNISPVTGEPEYQGETKSMIDGLRAAAKVSTYDQAIKLCSQGKSKVSVLVMNNPEEGGSIWVSGADQKPFWMPKGFLNKR
jgi:hypothetical protein